MVSDRNAVPQNLLDNPHYAPAARAGQLVSVTRSTLFSLYQLVTATS
jgi:hypothetical protein